MDISYNELRSKDVVNLNNGAKLGHIVDMVIDCVSGRVLGFVVPGERRIFKRSEDIIIPLEKVRRVGDDVILVRLEVERLIDKYSVKHVEGGDLANCSVVRYKNKDGSYIKYRKMDNKKYK